MVPTVEITMPHLRVRLNGGEPIFLGDFLIDNADSLDGDDVITIMFALLVYRRGYIGGGGATPEYVLELVEEAKH